jgi:hypothetical protein
MDSTHNNNNNGDAQMIDWNSDFQLTLDKIEELRAYEREYRGRLRSYLEGQLSELEKRRMDNEAITSDSNEESASENY